MRCATWESGCAYAVSVPVMTGGSWVSKAFGFFALVLASVNIFGGFLVTRRMLEMFKKKDKKPAAGAKQ